MTSGEVMALATVIGSVFTLLGVTGVDSAVISQAVNGSIALATIAASVLAFLHHRAAVQQAQ